MSIGNLLEGDLLGEYEKKIYSFVERIASV